ncbi:TetR/AcrR family transcriptional regulator [Actinoplanes friuliensis]|uniref:Putative transcriptional regulator, TetR family protein n=1 Tax=Actinoplanes friuliensis DSM 7358 TaxID=1246995 RepID=U5W1F5_9ACTN|nr:TetR family transcriptional regulator [Actinoplanes friuliensis]AGZ42979.1 putative transcriptional regulator, TetR family protein [Actinoplanes friuliensis DSM 7358]
MPNRGDRGGSKTRAHIADVATGLFLDRGFDNVTVVEVAAAAGVSKVTVFSHFDRKEDLLLDRLPDVVEIVRTAVRDRADNIGAVEAIRRTLLALGEERHGLSALDEGIEPFLRLVAESPALIARLRVFEHEIEAALAAELESDKRFSGDSALLAALVVAAYRVVAVATVRRRLAGDDLAMLATDHQQRVNQAFEGIALV